MGQLVMHLDSAHWRERAEEARALVDQLSDEDLEGRCLSKHGDRYGPCEIAERDD